MNPLGIDLHNLSYLARGSARQRQSHAVIEELGLFADLAEYTPALAGTIPLGVDIEGRSDLDIICWAPQLDDFKDRIYLLYNHHESFLRDRERIREIDTVIAWFWYDGWMVELFAQPVPVAEQYACLHLLVEACLLEVAGDPARDAIRELKRQGLKTEPAFAQYFGIPGDPYDELARLARASQEEILVIATGRAR